MTRECSLVIFRLPVLGRWILPLLLIAIAACTNPAASAREQLPIAKVVNVEHPSNVMPNEEFSVVVAVDYSDRYSTDIAVLDADSGYVLASKGLIIPAGRNLFNFSLTGRDRLGTWMLSASVRIWWHDGWYATEEGSTFSFQIIVLGPSAASLRVRSNLPSIFVRIDGISHSVPHGGIELSTTRGFHSLEVEPFLALEDGTRVVFDHWSDGVGSSRRQIYTVATLDLSATYSTEYLLTVESRVGETVGSGWYPAGMNVTFAAIDSVTGPSSEVNLRTVFAFSHWSGDYDSTSPLGSVIMDRPKTVVANWLEIASQATLEYPLIASSRFFLLCSVPLIVAAVLLRLKGRQKSKLASGQGSMAARGLLLALVLITGLTYLPASDASNTSTIVQPQSVTIGDAVWYHWNQAASDTLLIWLGGGIVGEAGYLVNPCEFESYNTILFIQDLANYYDVIALQKGSARSKDPILNRTVFREPYPSSHNFMKKIRSWAAEQGYAYLYVVGYSVGAMAAAQELALANPEEWTSPDGLIIITTKFPSRTSSNAGSLRASLLMLYGDKIAPEFTASGESFFQSAPEEGWRDGYWYHKDYHVIPDVEHEVWTVRDSGEYDKRAVLLTLEFVETTKSLQFEQARESISKIVLNQTSHPQSNASYRVGIESAKSPARVATEEPFKITTAVTYQLPSKVTIAVIGFDIRRLSVMSAAERQFSGDGLVQFANTLVSGDVDETLDLALIALAEGLDGWSVVTDEIVRVRIEVTDALAVSLELGYQDALVALDGENFQTRADGRIMLNTTKGQHLISVPPVIVTGDRSRAVFQQWNDTTSSPTLRVVLSRDMALLATYRKQYYLDVSSEYGHADGTGWYDEGEIARFQATPPVVVEETVRVFRGWTGDSSDSSPGSNVFMDEPKSIQATWRALKPVDEDSVLLNVETLFVLSLAALSGSLCFFAISFTRRRRIAHTSS